MHHLTFVRMKKSKPWCKEAGCEKEPSVTQCRRKVCLRYNEDVDVECELPLEDGLEIQSRHDI